jgi:hypothetical protein
MVYPHYSEKMEWKQPYMDYHVPSQNNPPPSYPSATSPVVPRNLEEEEINMETIRDIFEKHDVRRRYKNRFFHILMLFLAELLEKLNSSCCCMIWEWNWEKPSWK